MVMKSGYWAFVVAVLLCGQVAAQTPERQALVSALQAGGHVIVLRHTSSPRELPAAAVTNPDNTRGERQLDAAGRRDAEALGAALRRLGIPLVDVQSSPAYRALETARLAGFEAVSIREELGNEGMRDAGAANAEWLRAAVTQAPVGGNRLLITHGPNISAAFPEHAEGMGEGAALVFDPARPGFVVRIGIEEWSGF
jgi:phosphohistidine phosphatase SixA